MLVVCYQYNTFLNINIIGSNILLRDLSYTKVAVYNSNRCIANLSLA